MAKKLYPVVKFQVLKEFYLHINKKFEDGVVDIEPIYKLWLAKWGTGNKPFLILTNHIKDLELGDSKACLKIQNENELFRYFIEKGISEEILRKLCNEFNVKVVEKEGKIDLTQTLISFLKSCEIYRTTIPISDDYLKELIENPEMLEREIYFYITENCEKDPKMIFWAKTCLVKISDSLEDYKLERFRGHAFIVKNPKSGFSTFALKCGKVVDYSTAASVRGYCDSQGNIKHGTFHGQFGSLVFDQAEKYPELILDFATTPMENGIQFVESAARKITNLGAPKISIIMNAGKEIATPSDMIEAVDKILSKLTTTPEAHGSRFGLIIFDNNLKQVKENFEPEESIKNNALIIESIFEYIAPKVSEIYHLPKIQEWLNKPIEDYRENVLELVKNFPTVIFGERCKIFWEDHAKSGYKHMRGVALEAAIVDCVSEIAKANQITEELEKMLIEKAEENLEIVKSINLDSLRKMIEITEETEKTIKKLIIAKFEQLSGYKKAIVLCYSLGLAQKVFTPSVVTIFDQLSEVYESIPEEKRKELFGVKFSLGFSTIKQNLEKLSDKAKKDLSFELETKFGIEFAYSLDLDCWVLRCNKNDIEYLFDYIKELVR
jgi:hypothetical protein